MAGGESLARSWPLSALTLLMHIALHSPQITMLAIKPAANSQLTDTSLSKAESQRWQHHELSATDDVVSGQELRPLTDEACSAPPVVVFTCLATM